MTDKTEKISAEEYQRRLKAGTLETASKYGNKKVKWGDMVFDSKWEWERYLVLSALQVEGKIRNLRRQVQYIIQSQFVRRGEKVKPIRYIADFVYEEYGYDCKQWRRVIEDAKGVETDVFKLKWKMLKFLLKDTDARLILTRRGKKHGNTRKSRS